MYKLSLLIVLVFSAIAGWGQSPHGKSFKPDCSLCHNADSWKAMKADIAFNHDTTRFQLTGQHKQVGCRKCHLTLKFEDARGECSACHTDMHSNTVGQDCARCHTPKAWIVENTRTMHQLSRFPLEGNHAVVDCASCHQSASMLNFEPLGIECFDCHRKDYQATTSPNHQVSGYPTDCIQCHGIRSSGWTGVKFDHSSFPLTQAHRISCQQCHTSGVYQKISTECKSCHQTNYNAAQVPSHIAAGISVECITCHTATTWKPSSFSHTTTGFALTGAHATIAQCSACHKGNTTSAQPACISCHQAQYNNAPGHVASNFPTDCRLCHNNNSWLSATFNHSQTNFPLTGAHLSAQCVSCHSSGYAGTPSECRNCHQTNYNAAQVPSHTAAGIPVECKTCHTAASWKPSIFMHSSTGFALTGAHAAIVQCSTCHHGNTTSAQPACISCHQAQYNNAPGHVANNFPTDCRLCHNNNSWLSASFNHSQTNFPLTGVHLTVACVSCHASGYAGTSAECRNCHQTNYNAAQVPSHTAAGIPVECKTCHTPTGWKPSLFMHSSTGFPLTGAHAAIVQCSTCHQGNTTSAQPACISCHQVQYNNAPGHVASKFPTDCRLCHNNNNWLGATFNHSLTNFPLTGAHLSVECVSCHTAGYTGTSMECKSCHQTNYNSATNPNHQTLGLSVTCADCHTTNPGWKPASFPTHSTYFALTGAHATIANNCVACHNGNYSTTPNTCYGCHTTDYNNTKNPVHTAANFSTACTSCHTTTAWVPSTFNHTTYFPISSGRHTNISCVTCHTTPANYSIFTCVTAGCHSGAHNQSQGSAGCYRCHPTGRGD